MTGAMIAIVIVIWAALASAIRMDDDYPLPQALPFCDGGPPGIFDLVGCAVLLAFFVSLHSIITTPREKTDQERTFRQSLWLVPLALILLDYVRRNIRPSVHWWTVLDHIHVPDPERFSRLAVLIVTCGAVLAIAFIWNRR